MQHYIHIGFGFSANLITQDVVNSIIAKNSGLPDEGII